MASLDEKLGRLNPNSYTKRDADIIGMWKERVPELAAQKDWIGHPITKMVKADVKKRIADIRDFLADNDNLPVKEEAILRGELKALKRIFEAMSINPFADLEMIERAVDMELGYEK